MTSTPSIDVSPETILGHINEGVYITDLERRIIYWSPGAERITGWRAAEVVGTCCHEGILEHVDKDGCRLCGEAYCPLQAAILNKRRVQVPFLLYAKCRSGGRVPVEVTAAPYLDAAGRLIGGVEVFREKREQANDLEMARAIQQGFLLSEMPRGDRLSFDAAMLPMEMVGGDFLRVEMIAPGRFAFLLGDVIGHGLSGALYTMLLRSIWEENRAMLGNPVSFVRSAGKRLSAVLGDDTHFVSGIFGVFDEGAGELRYCDMGGPEFFQHHANGDIVTHKTFGEMLGLGEWITPTVETVLFAAGDRFLFFTDGLIELENPDERALGLDGIRERIEKLSALPAGSFCERMSEEIRGHSIGALVHDDISMLAVTVR